MSDELGTGTDHGPDTQEPSPLGRFCIKIRSVLNHIIIILTIFSFGAYAIWFVFDLALDNAKLEIKIELNEKSGEILEKVNENNIKLQLLDGHVRQIEDEIGKIVKKLSEKDTAQKVNHQKIAIPTAH